MERRAFFRWGFLFGDRRRKNRRWALILILSIPVLLFCERYVVSAGRVTDISMLPTLPPGSYFLINKYMYRFSPPRRGDIVMVRPPTHHRWYYVKRVVGLSGELLEIKDGRVFVDGHSLKESYAHGPTYPNMKPRRIPEGSCFLMGDNRPDSEDSRQFGPVPLERIEGKIKPRRIFSLW